MKVYRPVFYFFIYRSNQDIANTGIGCSTEFTEKSFPSSKIVSITYLQLTFWAKSMVKNYRQNIRLCNLIFQLLLLLPYPE